MNMNRHQSPRFMLNDRRDRSRSNTPQNLVNLCGNFLESSSDDADEEMNKNKIKMKVTK